MNRVNTLAARPAESLLSTNRVLKNTFALLAMTLLFSALAAGGAMALGLGAMNPILFMVGAFGLMFLTQRFANSAMGLLFVFLFAGFMGFSIGPTISYFMQNLSNGPQLVMLALAGTGIIFLGLSGYVLTSRKDFSFMGGLLMVGVLVAFLAGIGALIFSIPGLSLAVSAMFVLLMSGMILYQTSEIVHGGETNYILATVGLYVSIYNLFLSLLQLLGVFGGDD
jgi:modulator of FtsH protease